MNTSCKTALASFILVAASASTALAAPPGAAGAPAAQPTPALTTEAVIADLVASRQAPTTQPRDGEWYNVPAPLGGAAQRGHDTAARATQAPPASQVHGELGRK